MLPLAGVMISLAGVFLHLAGAVSIIHVAGALKIIILAAGVLTHMIEISMMMITIIHVAGTLTGSTEGGSIHGLDFGPAAGEHITVVLVAVMEPVGRTTMSCGVVAAMARVAGNSLRFCLLQHVL